MRPGAIKVVVVLAVLALAGITPCQHCFATNARTTPPACHEARAGHGQGHVPAPARTACSCAHHVCAVLPGGGAELANVVGAPGAIDAHLAPLVVTGQIDAQSTGLIPTSRASPPLPRSPVYLSNRSLRI